MTFSLSDTVKFVAGQQYLGGEAKPDDTSQGWLTAVDAVTGEVRWRHRSPRPMVDSVDRRRSTVGSTWPRSLPAPACSSGRMTPRPCSCSG